MKFKIVVLFPQFAGESEEEKDLVCMQNESFLYCLLNKNQNIFNSLSDWFQTREGKKGNTFSFTMTRSSFGACCFVRV